jgi:hypothetical protein
MKATVCLLAIVLVLAGCESYPHHPVTETAVPFYALNAANKKSAPNVTQNLTFERIRRAQRAAELADVLRRLRRPALQHA